MTARAVIAEDESLLAESLRAELRMLWPELQVVAIADNGEAAVEKSLAERPDIVFLDIRMPGMSGLEAAHALAEDWPEDARPFPLLVFVTAYDQYALQAFERAAIDYVLKPVRSDRLAVTCDRLRSALATRRVGETSSSQTLDDVVGRLRGLLADTVGTTRPVADATQASEGRPEPLRVIQVGIGNAIHMVRVDDVVFFEAADKYVRVVTAHKEHLIRASLRELVPRLAASEFWQIHRGTVVKADAIEKATRDESGRVMLTLTGRAERLAVSRLYAHLFKAM